MVTCPSCSAEQTETSKFCSECGATLDSKYAATIMYEAGVGTADSSLQSSISDSSYHGRFLQGTKIADRYRIVSLLGKGGMGEVYRADDLKLGHTVALKFLPKDLANDPQRLEYFLNEVRLSRQISHPNVCRVYDIGDSTVSIFCRWSTSTEKTSKSCSGESVDCRRTKESRSPSSFAQAWRPLTIGVCCIAT
jgi:serine/threonine protein kinase